MRIRVDIQLRTAFNFVLTEFTILYYVIKTVFINDNVMKTCLFFFLKDLQ